MPTLLIISLSPTAWHVKSICLKFPFLGCDAMPHEAMRSCTFVTIAVNNVIIRISCFIISPFLIGLFALSML